MGYRGKLQEREEGRRLRAENKTLEEIADALHVSKSSVSVWVRDVPFTPSQRRSGPHRRPHPAHDRKLREIEECDALGIRTIGTLDERAFLAAGVALYAGEGSKNEGKVLFANTDAAMVAFFCVWLRRFFDIDESRLRARVYLHDGLDLDAAEDHWSHVAAIPRAQFRAGYRAPADASMRHNKHEFGCCYVYYSCSRTHRLVMGLVRALLSSSAYSGVAQSAERSAVNRIVVGSSPTPGATARSLPLDVAYATPDRNPRRVPCNTSTGAASGAAPHDPVSEPRRQVNQATGPAPPTQPRRRRRESPRTR
jgi:hypothetical protein